MSRKTPKASLKNVNIVKKGKLLVDPFAIDLLTTARDALAHYKAHVYQAIQEQIAELPLHRRTGRIPRSGRLAQGRATRLDRVVRP